MEKSFEYDQWHFREADDKFVVDIAFTQQDTSKTFWWTCKEDK